MNVGRAGADRSITGVPDALRAAQRLGLLGARPVEEVIEHARAFVAALRSSDPSPPDGGRPTIVDIGSGGGVPGLVIAADRPDLAVTLVDRRQKCADFLERIVAALGLRDRVTVRCCDTKTLIRIGDRYDSVTARGFGPPVQTLRTAAELVLPGGRIVISEPPAGDRWPREQVERLGLEYRRQGAVAVFTHIPAAP